MRTTYDRRIDGTEVWVRGKPKRKRLTNHQRWLAKIDRELDRIEAEVDAAVVRYEAAVFGASKAQAPGDAKLSREPCGGQS
jgi:hypothetical protein